jgi:TonB family protein
MPPYSRRYKFCLAAALFLSCLLGSTAHSQSPPDADARRRIVQRSAPPYPALARNMALQGVVRLEVVVAPEGTVKTVAIRGGHPVLAQAAANTVRQWRWERASHDTTEPVEIKFDRPE